MKIALREIPAIKNGNSADLILKGKLSSFFSAGFPLREFPLQQF
jgi:hypothetical protein